MKKLLLSLLILIILAPLTYAGDCFKDPVYDRDWNGEVTTGMFVRNVACMEESEIITTVPVGEVVKVIAETDGWYKVQTKDGIVGWSGQWLLTKTNKTFISNEPKEPLYDVVNHKYENAIRYLEEKGIIQGYPDGSYRPENSVNRAEFTKIIVEAKLGGNPTASSANCFPDVKSDDWFAGYVCYAKNNGIIGGYPDGTFKPANTINLAEASKILVNTLEVAKGSSAEPWYRVFIEAMQTNNYIPDSFFDISALVSRSQMAEMIWRIMEKKNDEPAKIFPFDNPVDANTSELTCKDDHLDAGIDMDDVRQAWLDWHNQARSERNIAPLVSQYGLDYSASLWAIENESDKELSHTRSDGLDTSEWFTQIGINFAPVNGFVLAENLGFSTYKCNDGDCTDEVIDSLRVIFDAYMAEEGTSYTSHYDNIIEPDFKELGLGIAVDAGNDLIYIAEHYAQKVDSYPSVCK